MDVASLRPLEEVEVKIYHPLTKEPTDITFTVCGADSKKYRNALREAMVKRMANQNEEIAEFDNDEIEILAKCTIDFKGLLIDGKEPDKSLEGIIALYSEFSWIKDQIDKFIANKNNFFLKA